MTGKINVWRLFLASRFLIWWFLFENLLIYEVLGFEKCVQFFFQKFSLIKKGLDWFCTQLPWLENFGVFFSEIFISLFQLVVFIRYFIIFLNTLCFRRSWGPIFLARSWFRFLRFTHQFFSYLKLLKAREKKIFWRCKTDMTIKLSFKCFRIELFITWNTP